MQNIAGKIILVTGATAGIGKAFVIKALQKGAKLAICGRSEQKLMSLLNEIDKSAVFARTFDITDYSATIQFINDAIAHFGKIDILINNAGANTAKGNVADIKIDDYEYMIKLNQVAPFLVMREVFNDMRQRQSGRIINILSSVCLFSNPGTGSYTGSKSAFDGMTKVFRKEAAEDGVIVTAVYPGGVDTDFREMTRNDYLTSETVAEAIISLLEMNPDAAMHELVFRPHIEKNY